MQLCLLNKVLKGMKDEKLKIRKIIFIPTKIKNYLTKKI